MEKIDLSEHTIPVEPVMDLIHQLYATAHVYNDDEDEPAHSIKTLSMEIAMSLTNMIPQEVIDKIAAASEDEE